MAFYMILSTVIAVALVILHAIIAKKNRKGAALFTALVSIALFVGGLSGNLSLIGLEQLSGLTLYLVCGIGLLLATLEFILAIKNARFRIIHRFFLLIRKKILPLIQAIEKKLGKSWFGLLVSLVATLFILSVSETEMVQRLEWQFLDLRNQLRYMRMGEQNLGKNIEIQAKAIGKSPDIAVIKMDSISFADKKFGQMPWARTAYTIPLNHFSKGQLTVGLGWVNSPQGGTFCLYGSSTPIKSAADLEKADLLRVVKGMPHQTFTDHMLFKEGRYYFAVTEILADGRENRSIQPGKNSSLVPISIRIKPALKPDAKRWEADFRRTVPRVLQSPAKGAIASATTSIDQFQVQKYYPNSFFYDVFFIDKKSTVFRTPKGESFDPYAYHDKKLIEAFQKNSGIFIDYILTLHKQAKYPDFTERLKQLDRFALPNENNATHKHILYTAVDSPFPEVIGAVDGAGFAKPGMDADKTVRKFALVAQIASDSEKKFHPSAVLLLAMNYFKVPKKNVEIKIGHYIRLKKATVPIRNKEGRVTGAFSKDITIPIDKRGEMRINYIGPPDSFLDYKGRGSSFVSFPSYSPSTLHNRIFMIGLYEEAVLSKDGTTDFRKTPMGEMFGIDIMANTLNTILTQQFLFQIPPWLNALIVLLIGILLGLLLPRFSILKGAIVLFVFLIGIFLGGYFLYEANLIVNMALPILGTLLVFMALSVYKSLSEETEKKQIRNLFGKMANDEVVDEMLKNPDQLKLGGERRDMTVLFSDIRGFTTISESINNPGELVQLLNEYLNAMTIIVKENQGILDKYVGDEIMAFWGAPLPIIPEEQAFLACKTALMMMEKLRTLNTGWPESKQLNIGIGVNTGPMLVGYMGSESRMDYTVIGDAVNLGARLESANKYYKTNIIINEDTYYKIKDRVHCRELDLVRVKGKNLPVTIFELVGLKNS